MSSFHQQRPELLTRLSRYTSMDRILWEEVDNGYHRGQHDPEADFVVWISDIGVQLGKHIRKTEHGPRQTYFVRVLNRNGEEADFFDEFSSTGAGLLPTFSTIPGVLSNIGKLYQLVENKVRGTDDTYDEIFKNLP